MYRECIEREWTEECMGWCGQGRDVMARDGVCARGETPLQWMRGIPSVPIPQDVEDLVRDLVDAADGNATVAQETTAHSPIPSLSQSILAPIPSLAPSHLHPHPRPHFISIPIPSYPYSYPYPISIPIPSYPIPSHLTRHSLGSSTLTKSIRLHLVVVATGGNEATSTRVACRHGPHLPAGGEWSDAGDAGTGVGVRMGITRMR